MRLSYRQHSAGIASFEAHNAPIIYIYPTGKIDNSPYGIFNAWKGRNIPCSSLPIQESNNKIHTSSNQKDLHEVMGLSTAQDIRVTRARPECNDIMTPLCALARDLIISPTLHAFWQGLRSNSKEHVKKSVVYCPSDSPRATYLDQVIFKLLENKRPEGCPCICKIGSL